MLLTACMPAHHEAPPDNSFKPCPLRRSALFLHQGKVAIMSKRTLTWLRRHTNVEDLLDDGIVNNSDLSSFARSEQRPGDSPVVASTENPTQSSQIEAHEQQPEGRDFYVAAIGLFISGCGLDLMLHPVDMLVYHLKAIEHVTGARSEFYGAILTLFGAALLIYGLKKRRI